MTITNLQIENNSLLLNLRQEVADLVEFLKIKNKKESKLKSREFGCAKGKIKLSNDFDEPLEMFEGYF